MFVQRAYRGEMCCVSRENKHVISDGAVTLSAQSVVQPVLGPILSSGVGTYTTLRGDWVMDCMLQYG
jgi:hypothetical protein